MNDSMMPEWMKKKQEKNELEQARAEAKKQRELAAANLLELKRPSFWQQFREQSAIAVEFLPKLDMAGQITEHSGNGLRVSVNRPGVFANQTFTDLFFKPNAITATGLNLGAYMLMFCVASDTEVGVCLDGSSEPMTPTEAAEVVIRRMMTLIEARSH